MDLGRVAAYDPVAITGEERDAAVIVPVLERTDGTHLLFIKRADHLGEHPGQMSFPGGGHEPRDGTLRDTAVREAGEEIGLGQDEIEFVGCLDDIRTTSRYAVTPYVARIPDRTYQPDEREVSEVVVLPLAALMDRENFEMEWREHPRFGRAAIHFFHVGEYTVWGATGRILVQFLELATDWETPTEIDHVVDPDSEP